MSHVNPTFHEADLFLWFTDNGLSPYWAVGNLCLQHFDGYQKTTAEFADGPWVIRLNYNSETGIAPPRMYEFNIHADGPGERKANFVCFPRWDDQKKPDGEKMQRP